MASSDTSQTSSKRPASSTTTAVSQASSPAGRSTASVAASPQYTRISATASSSLGRLVVLPGLIVLALGSVAPVHDGGDFADHRTPAQAGALRTDLFQPATGEKPAKSAVGHHA